jgi:hypothetical protein
MIARPVHDRTRWCRSTRLAPALLGEFPKNSIATAWMTVNKNGCNHEVTSPTPGRGHRLQMGAGIGDSDGSDAMIWIDPRHAGQFDMALEHTKVSRG